MTKSTSTLKALVPTFECPENSFASPTVDDEKFEVLGIVAAASASARANQISGVSERAAGTHKDGVACEAIAAALIYSAKPTKMALSER